MKTKLVPIAALTLAFSLQPSAFAQGTAFTYQGRLNDGASPANGNYDFRFRLASDALGNNYVGGPVLSNALPVSGGLFTATLDFGAGVFTGSNYWLEVDVKTNGAGGFTTLAPLQSLTPSPYAVFAGTAASISGILPSGQLAGAYSSAVSLNNVNNSFTGGFIGNGSNLTSVNAAALGGLGAEEFWKTGGNSNTVPGVSFLGTADNQPLEVRVNNTRVLRIEPGGTNGPNVVWGHPANSALPGVVGAVIGGGGGASVANGALFTNMVTDAHGVVGGGLGNIAGDNDSDLASARYATVGGGLQNQAAALAGTIGGGWTNFIAPGAFSSTIAGGQGNSINTNSYLATIGGGGYNVAGAYAAVVGGGEVNSIQQYARDSFLGGGLANSIQTNAPFSFLGGGYDNSIQADSGASVLGGGYANSIETNAFYSVLDGGYGNTVKANAANSFLGGGEFNSVAGEAATVPGGLWNTASGAYSFAAGQAALAIHDGAFVWADASIIGTYFASTTSNQFNVRANGGVRFETAGAGVTVDGQAVATASALTSLNAASITSGTLADARLSPNVALLNANQTFTATANTFASDILMEGGAPYHHLALSGGNSEGFLYGSYPAFGDGIHLGYNYYADANGAPQIPNGGGGTSRISAGYGFVSLATGPVNVPPSDRVVVDINGNVGIGRTSAGNRLEVAGNASKSTAGSWLANSDARIKTGIATVTNALHTLDQVRLVSFRYADGYREAHPGAEDHSYVNVVAQEFAQVFPDYVKGSGEKLPDGSEILQVDTYPLTIYAAAAIQELKQKVDAENATLRGELKRRAAENAELIQRLEKLERLMNRQNGDSR